ncbi:hypothetical protein [Alcanivorax sp.]|uniref:hypothetical protein n=1 Tax=Alcanivorax sp. TaxID=1872427 RepID=UPI0025BDC409|nr:hypothetical protein [Alcanivorax sp.]
MLAFNFMSVSDLPILVVCVFLLTFIFAVLSKRAGILYYSFSLGCFLFLFVDYVIFWDSTSGLEDYKQAVELTVYSYWAVSIGFYCFSSSDQKLDIVSSYYVRNIRLYYLFILLLLSVFMIVGGGLALATFKYGRQFVALNSDVGSVGRGLQIVLAIAIPFYVSILINKVDVSHRERLGGYLAVICVALILFFQGNRYPILLSLAPFFLHSFLGLRNPAPKSIVKIVIFLIFGILVSNYVVAYREESLGVSYYDNDKYAFGVLKTEGILVSSQKMVTYFENNSFKYGASLFAVSVFWVPSSLWREKPPQIGYWLPRAYDGSLSETHSSSFGYYGVSYSDFGFWGAVSFSILIGFGLAVGSRFYSRSALSKTGRAYIACFLVAISFFLPRGISTPFFMVCGFLFFYGIYSFVYRGR